MEYKINEEIITRRVGDEIFILNLRGRLLHMLNETGVFIWNRLNDNVSEEDILKEISDRYDIDIETAKKDYRDFIKQMLDANILDVINNVKD
jgi:hypothetical protein